MYITVLVDFLAGNGLLTPTSRHNGMIYLLSASVMDVKLQSRPPADEWRKTGPSRGGTGEGPVWEVFLVESWRDVSVRMRHANDAIGPRENAFPTPQPPVALDGPESR